jgi:ribosome biogenesis protein Nip4
MHGLQTAGVVVYSMADIPLGFGVTAKSTNECRAMDPSGIVVFHQGDVGGWPGLAEGGRATAAGGS